MAQVVKRLPSKPETLHSNPSIAKKKKKKKIEEKRKKPLNNTDIHHQACKLDKYQIYTFIVYRTVY
jgi:hypothetical protein